MIFYNGLRFGHSDQFLDNHLIVIEYRISDGAEFTVKKADPNTLGGSHSIVEKNQMLSKECLSKKSEIKGYLLNLENKINMHKKRQNMEEIEIVAFRVKVKIFKYYSKRFKFGTRSYQSDWFELPSS